MTKVVQYDSVRLDGKLIMHINGLSARHIASRLLAGHGVDIDDTLADVITVTLMPFIGEQQVFASVKMTSYGCDVILPDDVMGAYVATWLGKLIDRLNTWINEGKFDK